MSTRVNWFQLRFCTCVWRCYETVLDNMIGTVAFRLKGVFRPLCCFFTYVCTNIQYGAVFTTKDISAYSCNLFFLVVLMFPSEKYYLLIHKNPLIFLYYLYLPAVGSRSPVWSTASPFVLVLEIMVPQPPADSQSICSQAPWQHDYSDDLCCGTHTTVRDSHSHRHANNYGSYVPAPQSADYRPAVLCPYKPLK